MKQKPKLALDWRHTTTLPTEFERVLVKVQPKNGRSWKKDNNWRVRVYIGNYLRDSNHPGRIVWFVEGCGSIEFNEKMNLKWETHEVIAWAELPELNTGFV